MPWTNKKVSRLCRISGCTETTESIVNTQHGPQWLCDRHAPLDTQMDWNDKDVSAFVDELENLLSAERERVESLYQFASRWVETLDGNMPHTARVMKDELDRIMKEG